MQVIRKIHLLMEIVTCSEHPRLVNEGSSARPLIGALQVDQPRELTLAGGVTTDDLVILATGSLAGAVGIVLAGLGSDRRLGQPVLGLVDGAQVAGVGLDVAGLLGKPGREMCRGVPPVGIHLLLGGQGLK